MEWVGRPPFAEGTGLGEKDSAKAHLAAATVTRFGRNHPKTRVYKRLNYDLVILTALESDSV